MAEKKICERKIRNQRRKKIKKKVYTDMGLPVGIIIQVKGTTHDENLGWRLFGNSKKSAESTGLKESLISMCSTILKALSSEYTIDSSKF